MQGRIFIKENFELWKTFLQISDAAVSWPQPVPTTTAEMWRAYNPYPFTVYKGGSWPDGEVQSRQGEVKVWPLIKRLHIRFSSPFRLFVNKALVGEWFKGEGTHPDYHSRFTLTTFTMCSGLWQACSGSLDRLFICFQSCSWKVELERPAYVIHCKSTGKKWHRRHCAGWQHYKFGLYCSEKGHPCDAFVRHWKIFCACIF